MNADGSLIATLYGSSVTFIDGRAGTLLGDIKLDHAATNMAWSRSSPLLVVSGDDRLTLVRAGSDPEVIRSAGAAGALWRLALSEQPLLVVAVARTSEHESALSAWHGEGLEPLLGPEPLGATAAFSLLVDPSRRLALLAGRKGRGGFSAGGDRFTGLVRFGEGSIQLLWKGEGLPFDPDGYLFPLAAGRLGVHSRDELVVLELPDDPSGTAQEVFRARLPEAEAVVASPARTLLAWRTDGAVRVARADTAEVVAEVAAPTDIGSFPALAVDDDGAVTATASDRPNIVHVFGSDGDRLALRGDVVVPAEPDRGDVP
jgi:hypothetical protein